MDIKKVYARLRLPETGPFLALGRFFAPYAVAPGRRGVELDADVFTGWFRLYDLAMILALVGEAEEALDRLEEAFTLGGPISVLSIEAEPNFDSLRGLARYQQLLDRYRPEE